MRTKQANSAKKTIYRVAIVDCNFNVLSYLPGFYSSVSGVEDAIENLVNSVTMKDWKIYDWNRHPWQTCEDKQTGSHSIEMVKFAEIRTLLGGYHYRAYGFVSYSLI